LSSRPCLGYWDSRKILIIPARPRTALEPFRIIVPPACAVPCADRLKVRARCRATRKAHAACGALRSSVSPAGAFGRYPGSACARPDRSTSTARCRSHHECSLRRTRGRLDHGFDQVARPVHRRGTGAGSAPGLSHIFKGGDKSESLSEMMTARAHRPLRRLRRRFESGRSRAGESAPKRLEDARGAFLRSVRAGYARRRRAVGARIFSGRGSVRTVCHF